MPAQRPGALPSLVRPQGIRKELSMHGTSVSTVTAYTAHREWATRPPDERYASVHALAEAARARRHRTDARITETVDLHVQALAPDALAIGDRTGPPAALTHWSFEQLAGLGGAP